MGLTIAISLDQDEGALRLHPDRELRSKPNSYSHQERIAALCAAILSWFLGLDLTD
ncbi:MAG: hypothetical protein ACK56Y_05095 [Pseudanabaena sp.]